MLKVSSTEALRTPRTGPQPVASPGCSYLAQVDPRARIVVAAAMSIVVALVDRPAALGLALGFAMLGIAVSGFGPGVILRRLMPLNLVMLLMTVLLPLTTPGTPLWQLGPLGFSREGLRLGVLVAVKGNVIVAGLLVLLGSLDAVTLGHALSHLRVPEKLAHLLLQTVRYLDVLHREYLRLRAAMKARGFRPRMDRHTYRTFGYLVGMLLVRGFDRSDRIVAAMKCRGFAGRFYLLDHFAFSRRDVPFCVGASLILAVLIVVQWA